MTEQEKHEFFDFLWDNWLVSLFQRMYDGMDDDFRTNVKAKICDLESIRVNAEKYFFIRYNTFKKDYYGYLDDEQTPDIHKICAILCRTLIEEKIIKYDISACQQYIDEKNIDKKNTDWLVRNALVNYRIAFYASITLLYQGMLFKYKDPVIHEKLEKNRNLNLYTKNDGSPKSINHESFENYMILDLAKRDVNNKSFEFFMYAAIMYQLEEYNRMILESGTKAR